MDRARLHYQYLFTLQTTVTEIDGWVLPSEPLVEIDMTLNTKPLVVKIQIPQT